MSTSAQVSTAWDAMFSHATIQAITTNAYDYEVTEESERDLDDLLYNQEFNFFEYLVGRNRVRKNTGVEDYLYRVELRHYREVDDGGAGDNWKATRNAFDTIDGLILSVLGDNWDGTIDFYEPPTSAPQITRGQIGDRDVWVGVAVYQAIKKVSI